MSASKRLASGIPLLLCALLALILCAPALLAPGLPAGAEADGAGFAVMRVQQMASALVWGHVPPRWMPDAAFGLGYPYWVFHGPLAWGLAALLALASGSIVGAIEACWLLSIGLAALGAWRLARSAWGGVWTGPLAASLYASSPLALGALYARPQDLAPLMAYALAPWLILALERAMRRPGAAGLAGLALISALSWTADPAATWMILPLALVWAGSIWPRPSRPGDVRPARRPPMAPDPSPKGRGEAASLAGLSRAAHRAIEGLERRLWSRRPSRAAAAWLVPALGLLLGAALAAWFLLPWMLERGSLGAASQFSERLLTAGAHGPLSWIDPDLPTRYRGGPGAGPPGTAWWTLALAGLGLAVAWRRGGPARPRAGALAAISLLYALASLSLALPLWRGLPLTPLAWQPWRWLAPQALALALLAAPLALPEAHARGWRDLAKAALPTLVLISLVVLAATWRAPRASLGVDEVGREDIYAFETFTGSLGSSPGAPHLPAAAGDPPRAGIDAVQGRAGSPRAVPGFGQLERATWTRREAARQDWQLGISPGGPVSIVFPTLAFPGWSLRLGSGPPRVLSSLEGSGWLQAEIDPADCRPDGRCDASLRLERSPIRALAEGLSLLALLWLLGLGLVDRRIRWGLPLVALLLTAAGLVALARALPNGGGAGPRILAERAAWPHRREDGLAWPGARLLDAEFRSEGESGRSGRSLDVSPGQRVELSLDWQAGADADAIRVAASLVSALEPRWDLPDILAWDEQELGDSDEPLVLVLPEELSDGLYFVRLELRDAEGEPLEALDVDRAGLGRVYLGPLRLRARADGQPAGETLAQMGDVSLERLSTELRELDGQSWLRVSMGWRTSRQLVLDHRTVLRLLDPRDDQVLAEIEAMPMHGLLPTTAWRAGEPIADRRWLRLPESVDPEDEIAIEVELIDGSSGELLGSTRVGDLRMR